MTVLNAAQWWAREDLRIDGDRLVFAGRPVADLVRQFGSPTFFYSAKRVLSNAERLHSCFRDAGLEGRSRIHYAMKANRFAPLLTFLKGTGLVGIDACSPNEVEHAIACGFRAEEISFTNTSLSPRDLRRLAGIDGLRINLDSIGAIRSWGTLAPGSRIGIRVNPGLGIGRTSNDKLSYSGDQTTKFGIYREQFDDALEMADRHNLTVDTIHFHCGCGYLTPQLEALDRILEEANWFVRRCPTTRSVNLGGGLGVPHQATDEPLDLHRWASLLVQHFGSTELALEIEPGDYLVKDAGILALSVCGNEVKRRTRFVSVDAGFNVAIEPAMYGLPFEPVPALWRRGPLELVTVVGNINEALDVWATDVPLPSLEEGDCLALINAGAYSSSMASNHCMRGDWKEFLLFDE